MKKNVIVALALVSLVACVEAEEESASARHLHVVCQADACEPAARLGAFDGWVEQALREPGSTFSVWSAADGGEPERLFTAAVPRSWGGGVMQAKAGFVRTGRERAGADEPLAAAERALPDGAAIPSSSGAAEILILGGDEPLRVALDPAAAPSHVQVVCDRSDSTLGASCTGDDVRRAYFTWLLGGGLVPGSSFAIWRVGRSRDTATLAVEVRAPAGDPGRRAARLLGSAPADRDLGALDGGSAIAEAIDVAVEDLLRREGGLRLVVFSDLRQVTPGTWNFERRVPKDSALFTGWLAGQGLLRERAGSRIELAVCGTHHRRGPGAGAFSGRAAARLVEVWRAVFADMGWNEVDIPGRCEGATGQGGQS